LVIDLAVSMETWISIDEGGNGIPMNGVCEDDVVAVQRIRGSAREISHHYTNIDIKPHQEQVY
jgi:hypothetical protein